MRSLVFPAVLLALLALGCTPQVYSPPARALPLEAPAALGDGVSALQLEAGSSSEVFGPSVVHAMGRARHGLTDTLDLSAEANFLIVTNGDPETGAEVPHRGIYSARLGLKYAVSPNFALTFGAGGGASAAGGFLSPDVGVIFGFENPHVVPFVSLRGFLSQPIAARDVTIPDSDGDLTLRPDLTLGFGFTTGIRIPFGQWFDARNRRAAALVGIGGTYLNDPNRRTPDEDDYVFLFGLNAGLEILL